MIYLMHCLTNLLFLGIPLFYCYTNLNLSIICCISSGDICLFLGVALSTSTSVSSFGDSLVDFYETLVILSAILLPIKSPVTSAFFLIVLFEVVSIASVVDISRSFRHIYYLNFCLCF